MLSIETLAGSFSGQLLRPHDEGFDEARVIWNGTVDAMPALIARCGNTQDVVRAVEFAARQDLKVSIRGGGHNVAGTALVDGGLVIDLSSMRDVHVDPDRRVARVQGGATLGDMDRKTFEQGLMTPSGFVSETGIGGLSLRGGLGHTMRRYGLTCDNLIGAELVTSDGKVYRVTEDDEDIMWALRGGPLTLGVVTEFEFRLHPVHSEVRLIVSAYPAEKGKELNRFMESLMDDAPRELGLVSFYTTLADSEDFPPSVRNREVLLFFGMYTGEREDAAGVLAPLMEHDDLLADLGGWMSYPAAQSVFDEEYPDQKRYYWKSLYLDELSDEVLDIFDSFGRDRPTPETTLDLWTMGGAVDDVPPEATAFRGRQAKYMVAIEANWTDPAEDERCIAWTRELFRRLEPHSRGDIYMNFPGSRRENEEAIARLEQSYLTRLRAVQSACDPQGLFAPATGDEGRH